jgi:hypothetical protein
MQQGTIDHCGRGARAKKALAHTFIHTIHAADPFVPDPSSFEVEIDIAKLKRYKSPGSDQILVVIQAGGEILISQMHKLITSV